MQILATLNNYKRLYPEFTTERICRDNNMPVSSYNRMRQDCNMPHLRQYNVPVKTGKGKNKNKAYQGYDVLNKLPTVSQEQTTPSPAQVNPAQVNPIIKSHDSKKRRKRTLV